MPRRSNASIHQQFLVYAGALPYAFKKTIGGNYQMFVLLGKEDNEWSDFGGDIERGESIKKAAAREAHEESLTLLGSTAQIFKSLRASRSIHGIRSIHYLLEIAYDDDLPRLYKTLYDRLSQDPSPQKFAMYLEKTSIQWFPLKTFLFQLKHHPKKFRSGFARDMLMRK